MPHLPDFLRTGDHQLWLLIGVCLAMVFTIEAVEEAVEGAWPHQRRATRMRMPERRAQPIWGLVALLLLPAAILEILTLATLAWKGLPRPETMAIGSILLGIGWVVFVLTGVDRLRFRRVFTAIGPVAPIALLAVLALANLMLLLAFVDIRPSVDSVRQALPFV